MKLAAVVYLANQDVIGYPIDYVTRSMVGVDELHLVAGDAKSKACFETMAKDHPLQAKITLHVIDHPITTVGGIPSMMERAVDVVRNHADFIMISQADTVMTPEAIACTRAWMLEENRAKGTHTYVRIGMFYQDLSSGWGHSLVGNEFRGSFFGDGGGKQADGSHMDFIGDINTTSLEIGSLGVDLYARHQTNHHKLWNERWLMGARLDAYDRGDRREFIRLTLQDMRYRIRNRPLSPVESADARFTKVIDDLGLRKECAEICALVQEYGLHK